jgi:hypothetical protein
MKIPFLILSIAILAGCSGSGSGDNGSSSSGSMDQNLIGTWGLNQGTAAVREEFSAPNDYMAYEVDTSVECEILATGTVSTSGDNISFTRLTGRVTSSACLTYFTGSGSSGPETYLVNPGVSLTLQEPGSTAVLVPFVGVNWANLPQGPTQPYAEILHGVQPAEQPEPAVRLMFR